MADEDGEEAGVEYEPVFALGTEDIGISYTKKPDWKGQEDIWAMKVL